MKDYIQAVSRETLLLFKAHPYKYSFLYLVCGIVGLWLASSVPEGKVLHSLPFYPVMVAIGLLLFIGFVGDFDTRNMRKKGLIPLIIASLLVQFPGTGYSQSIDLPVVDDNMFEFQQNPLMIPDEYQEQDQDLFAQPAAPIVVGAAVIVAAVIVYHLWDFCQRKFPKTPPPEDDPVSVAGNSDPNHYAMTVTYSSYGSCRTDDYNLVKAASAPAPLMVYELSGMVKIGNGYPEFRVSGLKKLPFINDPEENLQDLSGFKADLMKHGVAFDDAPGVVRYGKNGLPSSAEQVPIRFDPDTRTITIANGQSPVYGVVVERSNNLQSGVWTTVLKTRVPAGKEIRLRDVSDSPQMFYRLRPF